MTDLGLTPYLFETDRMCTVRMGQKYILDKSPVFSSKVQFTASFCKINQSIVYTEFTIFKFKCQKFKSMFKYLVNLSQFILSKWLFSSSSFNAFAVTILCAEFPRIVYNEENGLVSSTHYNVFISKIKVNFYFTTR